jgi:NMD protein affecting ribosome stability and mRNA decay
MNLVENHVTRATAEHPMRRLMTADDTPEGVLLTTTDAHLAREIGDALHDTYGGRVSYSNSFGDAQELLRVYWKR